uniref:RRM domain-containing protein n=1 Tax=Oryza glumipatula TaxID=40148 RepID=A0A0D9ZRH1_9ORYZ
MAHVNEPPVPPPLPRTDWLSREEEDDLGATGERSQAKPLGAGRGSRGETEKNSRKGGIFSALISCRIMSGTGYTVEVTNLSSRASESDLHEFFSFSGAIEHIELIRSGEYGSTAYVTFKEPYSLETAVLLSGATIVDQPVCIARWGQPNEPYNFWDTPNWYTEEEIEYRTYQTCQFNSTPQEALTIAQDVVKTMLARGYVLSKDALARARAFDESHQVTATAAAKAAELSKRIGLTDRVSAGVGAIRSVDETYHVSETTKTVATATGRTAVKVVNGIMTSSYFSAGAMMLSDALHRAAQAAADLAAHGRHN